MTHDTQTIIVADPRTFDGNPYEVAYRACHQAAAIAGILQKSIADAEVMARNAEMERNLIDSEDPRAADWDDSPQGKRFAELSGHAQRSAQVLETLARAASYDPKHPPKA